MVRTATEALEMSDVRMLQLVELGLMVFPMVITKVGLGLVGLERLVIAIVMF